MTLLKIKSGGVTYMDDVFEIRLDHGHYNVYINGEFYCSSDTSEEALSDIEEYKRKEYNYDLS